MSAVASLASPNTLGHSEKLELVATMRPVAVNDQVRCRVVFENVELDDLIVAWSGDMPTYNFSVVVDDHDMQITHVVRGDDHLNNTPRRMSGAKGSMATCRRRCSIIWCGSVGHMVTRSYFPSKRCSKV